eukprot:4729771-Pyramimonas_sp.AAC.1
MTDGAGMLPSDAEDGGPEQPRQRAASERATHFSTNATPVRSWHPSKPQVPCGRARPLKMKSFPPLSGNA